MNGTINSESDKLGKRNDWLERILVLAGALVVVGLLMESGPEIADAVEQHHTPKLGTVGGSLVTIGVAAEVLVGIFIAKMARQIQDRSNTEIVRAVERAAKAEQAAAEANLARVRIEQRFRWRTLAPQARRAFMTALQSHRSFRIDILAFSKTMEVLALADVLNVTFRQAGCNSRFFVAISDRFKIADIQGVTLAFAVDATPEENDIAPFVNMIVATLLSQSGIGYSIAFGGYKKTDPIEQETLPTPGFFPWDPSDVAPYRIQIVEKNLLDEGWPVTPPQA